MRNKIIKILMERDGMTEKEASEHYEAVKQEISNSNYDYDEVEEIMAAEFGLEMDYIFDIL